MAKNVNQSLENDKNQIYLWEYLQVLLKNRKFILRNCIVVFFLSIIISLVLPKKYTATATLLPPEQSSNTNMLGAFPSGLVSNLNILNTNSTADIFVQILLSRSVQQAVLDRKYTVDSETFNLFEYFDVEKLENGLKQLTDITTITASQEGIISISVELGSPQLAADVANAYVAELDSVNQAKSTSQAKNSRVYIENQLELTKNRLARADKSLAEFMQNEKAVSLEAQTQTAIEESGALKGRIIAKEVELAMKRMVRREDHAEIQALLAELDELRKQYAKMQYGSEEPKEEEKSEFYIPLVKVPDVSLRLAEQMREVKVQETVFELLNQQYYQAKIQEAKDTPTVQVLDEAIPPNFKSKPKRKLIVLLATGMIFILSIFQAFFSEYLAQLSAVEENKNQMNAVKNTLSGDWRRIKKIFGKKENKKS